MVRLLTIVGLMSICWSAHAELKQFKNQDAIQKVLTDSKTMSQIANQTTSTESASVSVVSHGNALNKKFIVRIAVKSNTSNGTRICYNDISVDSEINAARDQSGAVKTINQLVVKNVAPSVCKKTSALASRI